MELACVVTEAARQISKKDGSEWGRITVEDFHGTATVLAFGESWAKYKEVLKQDAPVLIRGAVSNRERDEEDPPVFLDGAVRAGRDSERRRRGRADRDRLRRARAGRAGVGEAHPGGARGPRRPGGRLAQRRDRATKLKSKTVKVAPRDELLMALREALGAGAREPAPRRAPAGDVQREERFPRRGGGGGGGRWRRRVQHPQRGRVARGPHPAALTRARKPRPPSPTNCVGEGVYPGPCTEAGIRKTCGSTSPRGFWGRCEPRRAEGARLGPAFAAGNHGRPELGTCPERPDTPDSCRTNTAGRHTAPNDEPVCPV